MRGLGGNDGTAIQREQTKGDIPGRTDPAAVQRRSIGVGNDAHVPAQRHGSA